MAALSFFLLMFLSVRVSTLERSIGLFNYITFPNIGCTGDGSIAGPSGATLNGDCYTKQECDEKQGTPGGDCALGYGVCCVFRPTCGGTIKQNQSYLIQTKTQAPEKVSCSYTICPVGSDVNRIRLDLMRFVIGDPVSLTAAQAMGDGGDAATAFSIGDCVRDRFVVTSTLKASPVICGRNNGQHMYVDTDGTTCVTASFVFGGESVTREYEIQVRQYERNNIRGGPPGCLQYFIDGYGIVRTFNFGDDMNDLTRTHLSNQNYDVCVRRERGYCAICWSPEVFGTVAVGAIAADGQLPAVEEVLAMRGSFGLSNVVPMKCQINQANTCWRCTGNTVDTCFWYRSSAGDCNGAMFGTSCSIGVFGMDGVVTQENSGNCPITSREYCGSTFGEFDAEGVNVAQSGITSFLCMGDHIIIPRGLNPVANDPVDNQDARSNKYCGRFLNPNSYRGLDSYVCSQETPFRISVFTDGGEVFSATNTVATDEAKGNANDGKTPLGTMGFSLEFNQQPC